MPGEFANSASGFGTGFLLPPVSPKPSIDSPYAAEIWQSRLTDWTPYPLLRDPIELPLHALYHHVCGLYLLVPDAQALAFAEFDTMKPAEKLDAARKMDARFMEWYRSIPSHFQFEKPDFLLSSTAFDLTYPVFHEIVASVH